MCQQSYMNNSLFLGDKYMYAKFHDPVPYGSLYILFSRHARCVVREYLPWICIAKILQLANLINSTKLIYETIYYLSVQLGS
jgi:hypothetical protein